jgi:hypothetical protein
MASQPIKMNLIQPARYGPHPFLHDRAGPALKSPCGNPRPLRQARKLHKFLEGKNLKISNRRRRSPTMADDEQSVSNTAPNRLLGWPRGMPGWLAAAYRRFGIATLRIRGPKFARIGQKRLVWPKEDLDKWLDGVPGRRRPPSPKKTHGTHMSLVPMKHLRSL